MPKETCILLQKWWIKIKDERVADLSEFCIYRLRRKISRWSIVSA